MAAKEDGRLIGVAAHRRLTVFIIIVKNLSLPNQISTHAGVSQFIIKLVTVLSNFFIFLYVKSAGKMGIEPGISGMQSDAYPLDHLDK